MINKVYSFTCVLVLGIFMAGCAGPQSQPAQTDEVDAAANLDFARDQLHYFIQHSADTTHLPRTLRKDGTVRWVSASDWTSGFFPGELWYMYDYTNKPYWKDKAQTWTHLLKDQQYNTGTHDVGFMMYCSYGNGYRLTDNADYKKILLQSARSLASRFNKKVGAIKSWDFTDWNYPVIIDNMMNLELLFKATQFSGDSTFYNIAKTHALTTLKNHFRPDGSTFHVVNYDSATGEVIWRRTRQGYADSSTWARGEAWALYGYTMTYRFTRDQRFLDRAQKIAHFILNNPNLPDDYVPYWDYDAPDISNAPRDVSAAAIMSSAFLELSKYVDEGNKKTYRQVAAKILNSLSTPEYRAEELGANGGFILKKSVGSKPENSEVSVPLIYADYYYVEANVRYLDLMNK